MNFNNNNNLPPFPPSQGYDADPPSQGYDANPPSQGYDAGPPSQGYNAGPPSQGYNAGTGQHRQDSTAPGASDWFSNASSHVLFLLYSH